LLLTDHDGSLDVARQQHGHEGKAADAKPHGRKMHALALQEVKER
jgi:hypothetical protein